MKEILGGIAEWLHENGVKTSFDVAYEEWVRITGLNIFESKLPSFPVLGILSMGNKSASFCWIDGSRLILLKDWSKNSDPIRGIVYSFELANLDRLDLAIAHWSFELADPGFLDDLLSKVR